MLITVSETTFFNSTSKEGKEYQRPGLTSTNLLSLVRRKSLGARTIWALVNKFAVSLLRIGLCLVLTVFSSFRGFIAIGLKLKLAPSADHFLQSNARRLLLRGIDFGARSRSALKLLAALSCQNNKAYFESISCGWSVASSRPSI